VVVSCRSKLIFFVLVDGWSLVAGSLVQSYGGVASQRRSARANGWPGLRRRFRAGIAARG